MLSSVFVARPRLAAVIAIVTTIAGILSLFVIPIAQYPDIVPPQVSVTTTYPGASASVVEATVAQPIESQVVGVDKAIYMKSVSGNDHLLAAGKTAVENRVGTLFTADLDAADLGFAVLDDKDIRALLIGEQRRLRHQHLFFRPVPFHRHSNELPVEQNAIGVRDRPAYRHRIGFTILKWTPDLGPTA